MSRRKGQVIGLLALLGMAGLAWLFWPRERPLLSVATKVASVDGWMIDRGPDACMAWGWVSDHEILHLYEKRNGREFFRLDTTTGLRTPLPALTKLFNDTHGDPDGFEVSPDGRKVLWIGMQRGRDVERPLTYIAPLDATSYERRPLGEQNGYARWKGDSPAWVRMEELMPDRPPGAVPPGMAVQDLRLSPRGDRLAWKLSQPATPRLPDLLSRWFPSIKPPAKTLLSLWVSRADGREMHKIGSIERREETNELFMLEPDDIRWTPDGKRLSFIYRNALYVVPAE